MSPRRIQSRAIARRLGWASAIALLIAALLLGIGLLPGRVEGIYAGRIFQCACGSFNFMRLENGRVIVYSSEHPPGELFGRYETGDDGTVHIYMTPLRASEAETLSFKATPHLWITRFHDFSEDDSSIWQIKRPRMGTVRKVIDEQEISLTTIPDESSMVTTYYNSRMEKLRETTKAIRPPRTAN